MDDRKERKQEPEPEEQRRQTFAPHTNPKQQADGDPGSNSSTREGAVNERSPEAPEPVQDQTTDD